MYSSTVSKRLLGIADAAWPESAPIEQLAMALGFEAVVSTQVEGLSRQKDLGVVVTKLQPGSSLQSMIESMRSFGEEVQFVIRADASDLQVVTTLARIPSVHVVADTDFTEATWTPIFESQLLSPSVEHEIPEAEPLAPQSLE